MIYFILNDNVLKWQTFSYFLNNIRKSDVEKQYLFGHENKENSLWKSGLVMGLSLSTKHLGLGTLFIFLALIILFGKDKLKNIIRFLTLSLGIALPWYSLAYFNTGNPFYPLFSGWFRASQIGEWGAFWQTHNPITFLASPWQMTFHLDNFLSPIFLIFLPLVLVKIWRQKKIVKIVAIYAFFGYQNKKCV